ncbi:RagB/SusD family nutrient uptake outer membrane protein [Emticicia sp. 21SJ11W-3]|uniref:RagB/SusD family nutrient uptake outer membrane protein n=1 Tax=Emticicia sp. 21SJ11W-3 TaxID=2916755 RepID=UPI0020A0598B|nr:RagB/SusD family nutrient uptake outer membrane protein [Emticicia sp. 21SJ11W-3]UTA67278.1 RagB/SusD family nutrient uptake outer membrane protein [Emticicia sp. 21SJ11W-3]
MSGCDSEFLSKKPDKALLIPQTLADFQALLDNNSYMNLAPYLPLISSDDLSITDQGLPSRSLLEINSYVWKKDLYENSNVGDWNNQYRIILYANIVLEGLEKTEPSEQKKHLQGTALFFRAWAHLHLAQQFSQPYDPAKAGQTPGIPLRLESDVNALSGRGTLSGTFQQIMTDLKESLELLPDLVPVLTRPSKNAARALLARACLLMQEYALAEHFAAEALKRNNLLLDYNQLTGDLSSATRPFPALLTEGNPEVIFYAPLASSGYQSATTTMVDSSLFNAYDSRDLRRNLFYVRRADRAVNFKGSYSGRSPVTHFAGLANDELYLILAECQARRNALEEAAQTINTLLSKRWRTGTFPGVSFPNAITALRFILEERRKELAFRGLRWSDLRRLNLEPGLSKDLSRKVNGELIQLQANDPRYTFPIPELEVRLNQIEQNPR